MGERSDDWRNHHYLRGLEGGNYGISTEWAGLGAEVHRAWLGGGSVKVGEGLEFGWSCCC
jgi:hypothetical protein